MTNKETIIWLEGMKEGVFPWSDEVMNEVCDTAISALSENKGDLISRQAVINAIANTCFWLSADNWEELTKCINSIPPAENKGECKECKWFDNERIYNPECENCSRNFNDNFCRSDIRSEREGKE